MGRGEGKGDDEGGEEDGDAEEEYSNDFEVSQIQEVSQWCYQHTYSE